MNGARLPEFLVIGTMKSGTTTMFRWLEGLPDTSMPAVKEPDFFTEHFERGVDWYRQLFPPRAVGVLSGEASVSYSAPGISELAAGRIEDHLPDVKLICLLRDPLDRARSHYRHAVQRGDEQRPFGEALGDSSSPYVRYSLYGTCLHPYLVRFDRRLLLIRFEDFTGRPAVVCNQVLDFLGLEPAASFHGAHNVSSSKYQFTSAMRLFWRRRWAQSASRVLPRPVRRFLRPVFLRRSGTYERLVDSSYTAPFPTATESLIWLDVADLERTVGHEVWKR